MKIKASAGRRTKQMRDVRDYCYKLELKASDDADAELLAQIYAALTRGEELHLNPQRAVAPLTEGKLRKGGLNPPNTSTKRPPAPKGSGG